MRYVSKEACYILTKNKVIICRIKMKSIHIKLVGSNIIAAVDVSVVDQHSNCKL